MDIWLTSKWNCMPFLSGQVDYQHSFAYDTELTATVGSSNHKIFWLINYDNLAIFGKSTWIGSSNIIKTICCYTLYVIKKQSTRQQVGNRLHYITVADDHHHISRSCTSQICSMGIDKPQIAVSLCVKYYSCITHWELTATKEPSTTSRRSWLHSTNHKI